MLPLKELRKRQALTRAELADLVGVDPATIWRIETGKSEGRPSTLRAIARVLEVPVTALFDEAEVSA